MRVPFNLVDLAIIRLCRLRSGGWMFRKVLKSEGASVMFLFILCVLILLIGSCLSGAALWSSFHSRDYDGPLCYGFLCFFIAAGTIGAVVALVLHQPTIAF